MIRWSFEVRLSVNSLFSVENEGKERDVCGVFDPTGSLYLLVSDDVKQLNPAGEDQTLNETLLNIGTKYDVKQSFSSEMFDKYESCCDQQRELCSLSPDTRNQQTKRQNTAKNQINSMLTSCFELNSSASQPEEIL